MAKTKIKWKSNGLKGLTREWAESDGRRRGEQVAQAQRSMGVEQVRVHLDDHPKRISVHIGSDDPDAFYKEAKTGRIARSLGAAR